MILEEPSWLNDKLTIGAIEIADSVSIEPLTGRKSKLKLMRTRFDFISDESNSNKADNYKVLPSMKNDTFHLRLQIFETIGKQNKKHRRFLLSSCTPRPFLLNNNLVFSSFIQSEDIVEVGHNRLIFSKKKEEMSEDEDVLSSKVIRSNATILLEGETGTGKTTLAHKIHNESSVLGEFVHLNLSAFSLNLLESEIFGHVKGAFTGAMNDKKGAIELANGGTLFLDEIDSLPLEVQTKLLLFLDNGILRPVGSNVKRKINCRLIVASGKKLEKMVELKKMRQDFFYRIMSGFKVSLPSLRDKNELIKQTCLDFSMKNGIKLEPSLIEFYQGLSWPGNFRQLLGHLERKKIMANTLIIRFDEYDEELLMDTMVLNDFNEDIVPLKTIRGKYAMCALKTCHDHFPTAALKLGISEKSLRKIAKDFMSQS